MQKSVPRSFSTELNLPRCVPGTPESAIPVLVGHDANQAVKQPNESVVAAHPKIYFGILGCSSKQALRADKEILTKPQNFSKKKQQILFVGLEKYFCRSSENFGDIASM